MTNYATIRYQPAEATTTTVADMTALIAVTGMSNGDQALVLSSNNLFMYSGTGWYKIATIQNDSPTAITEVNGTYELATDGTPTVITAVSTDPEGFPLTWTYSTSGLGSIATISQADNVFTITPSTTEANAGTFSLTINATDGVNGAVSATTNLTLEFIVIVTNSRYTTLLATATGTGDNNDITDSSSNNHAITVNGDTHAGTFSPYRHGGYSTYFDGSGDYLSVPDDASLDLGTGDFTLEAWVRMDSTSGNRIIFERYTSGNNGSFQLYYRDIGKSIAFWTVAGGVIAQDPSSSTIKVGFWHHIVATRESGTLKLYVDGSQVASASCTTNFDSTLSLAVGAQVSTGSNYFGGYISDCRIVKGTAVYTSNFTPPTERLTVITNTSLLTCHLPYIADGSSNGHSITVNGNTSTKSFTPYDNLEYEAADHGGSVYFDGTGDYLTVSQDTSLELNGDFTIEGWVYISPSAGSGYIPFFAARSSSTADRFGLTWGNSGFSYDLLLLGPTGTSVYRANVQRTSYIGQWMHFALVRISNVNKVYVDGTAVTLGGNLSVTDSSTVGASDWYIGYNSDLGGYLDGYISNFRVIKGTGLYTSDFTPPTAPLTAITNTSLLLSGTDASIIDKSQVSNLKLVGNTTGSTTQVKFAGSQSIYFDGVGDEIVIPASPLLDFSTEDFTIELWFRYSSAVPTGSEYDYLWGINGLSSNGLGLFVQGEKPGLYNNSYLIQQNTTVSTGQWYHIATVRSGNTITMYLDGTSIASTPYTADLSGGASNGMSIGRWGSSANDTGYFPGYIQDFRITKGLARYTANFTPPTEPLKG